jgi:hypothetical protein
MMVEDDMTLIDDRLHCPHTWSDAATYAMTFAGFAGPFVPAATLVYPPIATAQVIM